MSITYKMIKAIFLDVDGTLVSFKTHRISESTKRALDRVRENGIMTFVATGRQLSSIDNLGGWTPDGYVTVNGGFCLVDSKVVHKRVIEPDDVTALLDRLEKERLFPFVFIHRDGNCMNYANDKVHEALKQIDIAEPPVNSIDEIRRMEIFQILGFFGEHEEPEVMKLLPHCHTTRWTHLFADIIPAETDKWDGISSVLEHLGIAPEETMAFGDGGNDITMLRGAGIGVAMGNAGESVRGAADYVTSSVDDEGVAAALKHFGML